jgi:hypothetical protein
MTSRHVLLASAALAAGCAMPLQYTPTPRPRIPVAGTVGVYLFQDARPGWPGKAFVRTVWIDVHSRAEVEIKAFVTEAIRAELAAGGANVLRAVEFDRSLRPTDPQAMRPGLADRVVLGRINYFGVVRPGETGSASIHSGMPTAKAFVDLDLWVLAPSSAEIIWAGTTRHKYDSNQSYGDSTTLAVALRLALLKLLGQKDFWSALNASS